MPKSNTETLRHLILKHGGLQELSANDPPSNTEHAERGYVIAEAAVYLTMLFGNQVCNTAGSDSHDCHFHIV